MLPQVENKAKKIKKVEDGKYKKGPLSHSIGKNKIKKYLDQSEDKLLREKKLRKL